MRCKSLFDYVGLFIFLLIASCSCISVQGVFAQEILSSSTFKFKRPDVNNEIRFSGEGLSYKRTFYVDASIGNDNNIGIDRSKPLKSLQGLEKVDLRLGDEVLLCGNQVYRGTIELINKNEDSGSSASIHIGSYGPGKATIDFAGYPSGIWIQNTSNVVVSDLKLTGNGGPDNGSFMVRPNEKYRGQRYGIRILSDNSSEYSLVEHISIHNVDIYDVFLLNPVDKSRACVQWDMNDNAGWGWGIFGEVLRKGQGIRDIDVCDVTVQNVSQMGIRFKGGGKIDGSLPNNVDNLRLNHCTVYQSGGPGMQFNKTNNSYMKNCRITESGNRNDNRKWGRGSGMWTWGLCNFLLEHNIFEGAQGIADCCGAHIDFNCRNVVIQYCLSRYNCGGFVEILGLNYNCCYRYNVSINDGWRNLKDKPVQDFWGKVGTFGCLVTVNGHNHEKQFKGPNQSYVYNNTIVCTEQGNEPYKNPYVIEFATSNRGLVVMNNIFWIPKKATTSWSMHRWKNGKDYDAAVDFKISESAKSADEKPDKSGSVAALVRNMSESELESMELVMKNNLYQLYNPEGTDKFSKVANALAEGYWDENALGGDPGFRNVNGNEAEDLIPSNVALISKGMPISKLKSDKTPWGVYYGGLQVTTDFFGKEIKGNIIGAIMPVAE